MRRQLEARYRVELIGEIMHVAQGDEQFFIDFFHKKGGAWKRRLHYHDFYELEFVQSGSAACVINDMRFPLSRGTMFLIRPTDMHRYEIAPGEEINVCTVRFTSALLDREIVAALSGGAPLIADFSDRFDFLCALLQETRREYLQREEFSEILFSGVCERLAVMLCRRAGRGRARSEAEQRALEPSDVVSYHDYRSYSRNIDIIEQFKLIGRPIFDTEWLHRIFHNDVQEIYPLLYLEKIGCYNWGFVAGKYQTYEPWEAIWATIEQGGGKDYDMTKWQHDLFRPSLRPYDPKKIELIKRYNEKADARFKSGLDKKLFGTH